MGKGTTMTASYTPEARRETRAKEIEVMKGRGDRQVWFYVASIEDAKTLVRLGRNRGFPTGVVHNYCGPIPLAFYISEGR